ncbi:MAG: right-handed parallel beta-helix repeat-containing protein [Sphingomonadales bacterium]|nr:MAG: right-handed parallel beta-helix repeat-containing protein [Sphingomonadales bacterium]
MTRKPSFALNALAAALALPAAVLVAQTVPGAFTVAETGRSYATLQDAVNAVGNTRATIRIAPGTYRQCAVQEEGVIVYEAAEPGTVTLAGRACEDKASLVLRGTGAEVRGLTFSNINVADGNGSGIRLETGSLNVAYARFENSQQGILTAADPAINLYVTRSTFTGLGTCENDAGCAHSLYIGDIGSLTVRESRFERGTGGHYLKARAAKVVIEGNSFDDANGRTTNYMIDLPAGSVGRIADNRFVQGRDKENYSTFIALGSEDLLHPSDGLRVENNEARFVPGLSRETAFFADWTGSRIVMQGNKLAAGIRQYEPR